MNIDDNIDQSKAYKGFMLATVNYKIDISYTTHMNKKDLNLETEAVGSFKHPFFCSTIILHCSLLI